MMFGAFAAGLAEVTTVGVGAGVSTTGVDSTTGVGSGVGSDATSSVASDFFLAAAFFAGARLIADFFA